MEAYADRTRLPCSPLSFQDLANGKDPGQYICLPGPPISTTPIDDGSAPTLTSNGGAEETVCTDIIVCSFALHLVDSPSELFSLLWVLSTKARWLVILAPHKRPSVCISYSEVRSLLKLRVPDQGRLGMEQVQYPTMAAVRYARLFG
jgi:hypothetical protein